MHCAIKKFINNLKDVENTYDMENPYQNQIQANNLFIYLHYMVEASPDTLFVGEAPGYKGCALMGVPFY